MIHGSCLFSGRIYNLDSLVGVIPKLVFPIYWDDENCELIGNTNIGITPTKDCPDCICSHQTNNFHVL